MENSLADRYWYIRVNARSRVYYNGHRLMFWSCMLFISQFSEFLLSTTSFIMLQNHHPTFALWATFAVSVVSFLVLWIRADKLGRQCSRLIDEYSDLEASVTVIDKFQTEEGFAAANKKMLELMSREKKAMPCLGTLCYIDACLSFGARPNLAMSWLERTVGRFLPIRYKVKPV